MVRLPRQYYIASIQFSTFTSILAMRDLPTAITLLYFHNLIVRFVIHLNGISQFYQNLNAESIFKYITIWNSISRNSSLENLFNILP